MLIPKDPPPVYLDCIRHMASAIELWRREGRDEPRFVMPPVGVGISTSIDSVYPLVCANAAARELLGTFQQIGVSLGLHDPTLTQLACALVAARLPPYRVENVEAFQRCKREVAKARALGGPRHG
jgi:hypothetical protein